jgi:hypothetical protein
MVEGNNMQKPDFTMPSIMAKERRIRIRETTTFVVCCLNVLILVSCLQSPVESNLAATPYQSQDSPSAFPVSFTPSKKIELTVTPYPSLVLISTLQSYPTPISVYKYPGQVTDGILLLSVERVADECHNIGDLIELKFLFKNLTEKVIKIPSDFVIAVNRQGAGGNLHPFVTSIAGKDVYGLGDVTMVDIFSTPSRNQVAISAYDEIGVVLRYEFPKYIIESQSDESNPPVTPSPGHYFLRFVYSEYKRNTDVWFGVIGSNQVEICITN